MDRSLCNILAHAQTARVQQLVDGFTNLSYLSTELVLPAVPIAHPHHFPIYLLPPRASEERPGAHATYEKSLSRFITANPAGTTEVSYETLDGVEPEVGLLSWIQEIEALVRGPVPAVASVADDSGKPSWTRGWDRSKHYTTRLSLCGSGLKLSKIRRTFSWR